MNTQSENFENEQKLQQSFEGAQRHESREAAREEALEKEQNLIQGAELLENPPDGSFMKGLQVFVAWVANLLASSNNKSSKKD